jgi:DNA polymerase-1
MFPERTPEECRKIDAAYYTAFPGVKEYHNYCYRRAQEFSWTENMFGIKYYGLSGHKLINTLVQGSAAVFLKLKIIELNGYMEKHKLKSKLQMQIHDELSWCLYKGEESEFFELQKIMESWEDTMVPIVADMEITHTNWAEKFEVNNIKEML